MNELYKKLKEFGKVRLQQPLSKYTTFKIGGPAQAMVLIDSVETLPTLLRYLDGEGVAYIILGGGSNMLAGDDEFEGVVISIKDTALEIDGTSVVAAAGVPTIKVAQESVKAGLTGFEWGVGVPGTIGGAVRGNAGAMGREMKDSVVKIEAYIDGEVVFLSNEECIFGYRDSVFKEQGGVVLRVFLSLEKATDTDGMKRALEVLGYRNKTQPKGAASTGCIFKNPDYETYKQALLKHFDPADEKIVQFGRVGKISAGWLVEQAGLKGIKQGNAQVSDVHGNFIVNLGGAQAKDVTTLIEEIKEKVYTTYDIPLEEEIALI